MIGVEGKKGPHKRMAPQVGLEPTTLRLTAGCSAFELLRSEQSSAKKDDPAPA
jgi:hypothetical protein